MLQRKYRFHGYNSLRYLFRQGKTVRVGELSLRFAPNPRRSDSRVAVVITRKLLKSAPKRNRIRRRIYEVLRTNWLVIMPGYDVMVSVFDPHYYDMPAEQLQASLYDLFDRARLIRQLDTADPHSEKLIENQ